MERLVLGFLVFFFEQVWNEILSAVCRNMAAYSFQLPMYLEADCSQQTALIVTEIPGAKLKR